MGNNLSCVSCNGGEPTRKPCNRTEVRMAPDITSQDARETAEATRPEEGIVMDKEIVEGGSIAVPVTQGEGHPDVATARCPEDVAADIEDVVVVALTDAEKTAREAISLELGNVADEERAATVSTEKTSDVGATGPDAVGRTARGKGKAKATVSWCDAEPETEPTKDVTGTVVSVPRARTQTEQTPRLCDTLQKYINQMGVGDFVGARFLLPQYQPGAATQKVPDANTTVEHIDVNLYKYQHDCDPATFDEKAFYNKRRWSGPGPKQVPSPPVDLSKWPLNKGPKKPSFGNGDISGFQEEAELIKLRNSRMQVDAAGSYVNIVVYLASQVFYPAYLTYLQQKKPDQYDQKRIFLEKYTDPKRIMKTDRGREYRRLPSSGEADGQL